MIHNCQNYGVFTPEAPYPFRPGDSGPCRIAPLLLLYDYTFRPDNIPIDQAVPWAAEIGVVCSDEELLHPDPYPSRTAGCQARVRYIEQRLEAAQKGLARAVSKRTDLALAIASSPAKQSFNSISNLRLGKANFMHR
ncbi:MAG: hypothetical protein KDJ65_05415 [Anaerolineae bacterium]|nr:hypothetical protein [Anaerolineae bacterium]